MKGKHTKVGGAYLTKTEYDSLSRILNPGKAFESVNNIIDPILVIKVVIALIFRLVNKSKVKLKLNEDDIPTTRVAIKDQLESVALNDEITIHDSKGLVAIKLQNKGNFFIILEMNLKVQDDLRDLPKVGSGREWNQ